MTSASDQRTCASYTFGTAGPAIGTPAAASAGSVTRQLPVRDPVRPRGLDAEPVDLVALVRLVIALEPEPRIRMLVGALPREDVGGDSVDAHPVVRDDHGAAGEFEQRVL